MQSDAQLERGDVCRGPLTTLRSRHGWRLVSMVLTKGRGGATSWGGRSLATAGGSIALWRRAVHSSRMQSPLAVRQAQHAVQKTVTLVHLLNGGPYTDITIEQFERIPASAHLYLIYAPGGGTIQWPIASKQPRVCRSTQEVLTQISGFATALGGVIVHGYGRRKEEVLVAIKRRYPTAVAVWLALGGDVCAAVGYPLFQRRTQELAATTVWRPRDTLGRLARWLTGRFRHLELIDYCATVLPDEYELLTHAPGFRATRARFAYGSIEKLLPACESASGAERSDVLVGNSASLSNNHLDMFETLRRHGGGARGRYVVPLGYGARGAAVQGILAAGQVAFGARYEPLRPFLPLPDYARILRNCGVAVFNHKRQEGLGTTMALLSLGARVYLCDGSPTYTCLRRAGLHVFSLERDLPAIGLELLGTPEQEHNQRTVNELCSEASVLRQTSELVDLCRSSAR